MEWNGMGLTGWSCGVGEKGKGLRPSHWFERVFLYGGVSLNPVFNRRHTMLIDTKRTRVILCKRLIVSPSARNCN